MTLRTRLTLVAAGVVAFVVVLASVTTYFVMRHELQSPGRWCASDDSARASRPKVDSSAVPATTAATYVARFVDSKGQIEAARRVSPSRAIDRSSAARWLAVQRHALRLLPQHHGNATRAEERLARFGCASARSRSASVFRGRGAVVVACELGDDQPGPRPAAVHPRPRLAGGRRAGSSRWRPGLGCDAGSGSPPHGSGRTDRRDGRAERARPGGRKRRAGAPRCIVQHDACLARGVARDAAALRRRRLARAPHAADEPADEHRRSPRRHRS